jgi:hypothetical protein
MAGLMAALLAPALLHGEGADFRPAAASNGQHDAVFAPGDMVLPQIANGTLAGGQYYLTQFEAVNITDNFAKVDIQFFDSNGVPMTLPLTSVGQNFPTNDVSATVQARGYARVETVPAGAAVQVGYAIARSTPDGSVIVTARFSNRVPNERLFSAAIPLETAQLQRFQFSFTNTNNVVSSLAVVSANAQTVTFTARDANGLPLCTASKSFAAGQHFPFILTDVLPCTANTVGTVDVQGQTTGLSGVGFLANDKGAGAFVTLPVYGVRVP